MDWCRGYRLEDRVNKSVKGGVLGGSVKEYVNCVSIPEYGLDWQSRHSKSCVVNNGTWSTKVLRVPIGYRSTRSKVFRLFGFRSKRCPKQWRRRASPGSSRSNNRAHFSQQCDQDRTEISFRSDCISTLTEWYMTCSGFFTSYTVSGSSSHPCGGVMYIVLPPFGRSVCLKPWVNPFAVVIDWSIHTLDMCDTGLNASVKSPRERDLCVLLRDKRKMKEESSELKDESDSNRAKWLS